MSTEKEKLQLVIEAKERASVEIQKLRSQLSALGGTDMVKAQREINRLNREVTMLSGGAKKGTAVFSRFIDGIALGNIIANAASRAFTWMKDQLVDTVKEAADAVVVWNALGASMERHNIALETGLPAARAFGDQMIQLTGISDELTAKSLQRFIDTNNNLGDSMRLTAAAMDFAVAKDMDLVEASNLLAKSLDGKVSSLGRYGIAIDKTKPRAEQLEQMLVALNSRFGGAAAAQMETNIGQWKRLSQNFGELKENIGAIVLNSSKLSAVLQDLNDTARWWASAVAQPDKSIQTLQTQIQEASIKLRDLTIAAGKVAIGSEDNALTDEIKRVEQQIKDLQYKMSQMGYRGGQAKLRAADEEEEKSAIARLEEYRASLQEKYDSKRMVNMVSINKTMLKPPADLQKINDWRDIMVERIPEATDIIHNAVYDLMVDDAKMTAKMKYDWQDLATTVRGFFQELASGRVTLSSLMQLVGKIPGLGLLGTIGSFLPFDDPVNDAALRREHRNIGRIIAQGLSEGTRSIATPKTVSAGNTIAINIAAGVSVGDFKRIVEKELVPVIEQMSKNGKTRIVTNYKRVMK